MKQTLNELVRHVTLQGGVLRAENRLDTLSNSLPKKYDLLLESYHSAKPAPDIHYIWDTLLDIELTTKRREKQSGGSVHPGQVEVEGYY